MSDIVNDLMEVNYLYRLLVTAIDRVPNKEYKRARNKIEKIGDKIFKQIATELKKQKFTSFEELLFFDMIQRTIVTKYYDKYGGVSAGDVDVAYQ